MNKKFIITIDTESDNQWDIRHAQETANAKYIPRFQAKCESYGFLPVYLVDYSMGNDEFLVGYLKQRMKSGECEVGMHLHAWSTPPQHVIDFSGNGRPYLIEYSKEIMEMKIKKITDFLEERFETKMISHRAGRWAINDEYIGLLAKYGYKVDCSITPGIDWRKQLGNSIGGCDYRNECEDIGRVGKKGEILEVPMTVRRIKDFSLNMENGVVCGGKRFLQGLVGRKIWLRPSICSVSDIIRLIDEEDKRGRGYLEFMMHSSEFMPGGSPYYKTEEAIDAMYEVLDTIFSKIRGLGYEGSTLAQIGAGM